MILYILLHMYICTVYIIYIQYTPNIYQAGKDKQCSAARHVYGLRPASGCSTDGPPYSCEGSCPLYIVRNVHNNMHITCIYICYLYCMYIYIIP